jgi:hypothetical protein
MTLGKFKSLQPLVVGVRKRKTRSKKEQETTLEPVLIFFFKVCRFRLILALLVGSDVRRKLPPASSLEECQQE